MKRVETVLPVAKGGLNMPDIKVFWNSLKCAWARRLMNYQAAWHKILQASIMFSGYDLEELLYEGPETIIKCASRLSNNFWKETLNCFAGLMSNIGRHKPEFFFSMNIFDNDDFK